MLSMTAKGSTLVYAGPSLISSHPLVRPKLEQLPHNLFCQFEGFAVVEVTGTVDVEWMNGTNAYICNAQTIKACGEGQRLDRTPWVFLLEWQGKVRTSGVRYQIQLGGGPAAFSVVGHGFVRLRGKGYCTVNGRKHQLTAEFQKVDFG